MRSLYGKIVVVTGAASEIGWKVAQQLVRKGTRVIALDAFHSIGWAWNINPPESAIQYLQHDPTVPKQWDRLMKGCFVRNGYDDVDILVNVAGRLAPFHETGSNARPRVSEIDVNAAELGMKAVMPLMRAGGGGVIINILSSSGSATPRVSPADHTAKEVVTQLTRNAAIAYAPYKIRVNAIKTGVGAPIPQRLHQGVNDHKTMRAGASASASDIVNSVLFMASDEAAFMTGTTLVLDCGFSPAGGFSR